MKVASGRRTRKYNEDTFFKVSCKFCDKEQLFYKTLIKKETRSWILYGDLVTRFSIPCHKQCALH